MTKIIPEKSYSLSQVQEILKCKSYSAVRTILVRDQAGKNILQPTIHGDGRSTRIYIKGSNIITFLKK